MSGPTLSLNIYIDPFMQDPPSPLQTEMAPPTRVRDPPNEMAGWQGIGAVSAPCAAQVAMPEPTEPLPQ
ncbi:hypothetical protein KVR01_012419 [Diaporthe batatas]|uniref:uncharacterized protein n=1 Tax=Diaporthe batatas TaxID=748121 RepID=UPI001D036AC3|nr:uncharacterized protein KVR01_012419 [Diaporthe batatas]KAG8157757.1 hypothetical protein KVR01_012419 [Diaporthe batatas]